MPDADDDTHDQLLQHQFISGLPGHISEQLGTTGEINDLDTVIEWAKLLLAIEESRRTADTKLTETKELKEQISVFTKQVAALITNQQLYIVYKHVDTISKDTHKGTVY